MSSHDGTSEHGQGPMSALGASASEHRESLNPIQHVPRREGEGEIAGLQTNGERHCADPQAVQHREAALLAALRPFVDGAPHTLVFLSSRQKMHPDGQALYREDVERARALLDGGQ